MGTSAVPTNLSEQTTISNSASPSQDAELYIIGPSDLTISGPSLINIVSLYDKLLPVSDIRSFGHLVLCLNHFDPMVPWICSQSIIFDIIQLYFLLIHVGYK